MNFIDKLLVQMGDDSKITETEEDKIGIAKITKDLKIMVKELTNITDLVEILQGRKRIFKAILQPGATVTIDTLNLMVVTPGESGPESKRYGLSGNDIAIGLVKLIQIANEENDRTIELLDKKILMFENNPTAENINNLIQYAKQERAKINGK